MKRLIFFLIGLFLLIGVQGQSLMTSIVADQTVASSGGSYCTEYQAVYDAMIVKPPSGVADAQNTLVQTLVTDGIWAKLDLFYVIAQFSNANGEALINWPNPGIYDLTEIGAGLLTFTSLEGLTGDGINYLTTGYNISTDNTNYSLNSGSMGIYFRVNLNETTHGIAAQELTNKAYITGQYSDITYGAVNQTTYSNANPPGTNGDAFWVVSRTASNAVSLYKNGTSFLDATTASNAIPNDVVEILAKNGSYISHNQVSVAFVGSGLSATEVLNLTNAIETYMDSNGKGIIP